MRCNSNTVFQEWVHSGSNSQTKEITMKSRYAEVLQAIGDADVTGDTW